jgi:hypothetical protein
MPERRHAQAKKMTRPSAAAVAKARELVELISRASWGCKSVDGRTPQDVQAFMLADAITGAVDAAIASERKRCAECVKNAHEWYEAELMILRGSSPSEYEPRCIEPIALPIEQQRKGRP